VVRPPRLPGRAGASGAGGAGSAFQRIPPHHSRERARPPQHSSKPAISTSTTSGSRWKGS
jgi:hypothetical protein